MAEKQPRIVAELGRPETAEETAARKAENTRKHRANQTLRNLIGATVASLGIVLFLVLVVVRPNPGQAEVIDYAAIASDAQSESAETLIAPIVPPEWSTNAARFSTVAGVSTWYIGFVTPATETTPEIQFIALNQGVDANATWVDVVLDGTGGREASGTTVIDGLTWQFVDRRADRDSGNFAYSMTTTAGSSTIVLHGTAATGDFELLAASIAQEMETR